MGGSWGGLECGGRYGLVGVGSSAPLRVAAKRKTEKPYLLPSRWLRKSRCAAWLFFRRIPLRIGGRGVKEAVGTSQKSSNHTKAGSACWSIGNRAERPKRMDWHRGGIWF